MTNPNPPGDIRHLAIFRVASYRFCAPADTIAAITDVPAWTRIRDPDLIYPDDVIRIVRRPSGN